MSISSINPATGETIARFDPDSGEAIERRLGAARAAAKDWGSRTVEARAEAIKQFGALLRADADRLALLITREMGKPITQARAEVEKCASLCDYLFENGPGFVAAEPVDLTPNRGLIVHQPLGPIFSVAPWNFPIWQALRFALPNLVLGNPVLLKPAMNVAGCALGVRDLFAELDAPPGTFDVTLCDHDQAAAIIADARIAGVTLTGSERAGATIAAHAGAALKKCVMELGGSDPFIVLSDADLDKAADAAIQSRFTNAGQVCISAKRWIVDARIANRFTEAVVARVEALNPADPEQDDTFMGPMARTDLRAALWDQVTQSVEAGARVLVKGGPVDGPGCFMAPSLLADVPRGAPLLAQEAFGPAAQILTATDEDEALRIANDTPYGLAASIWTADEERAQALALRIESGMVSINAISASDPRIPFGGIKRSGFGKELGRAGMLEFANSKSITLANG